MGRPADDSSEISIQYTTSGYSTPYDDAEAEVSFLCKTNSQQSKIDKMIKDRIVAAQGK